MAYYAIYEQQGGTVDKVLQAADEATVAMNTPDGHGAAPIPEDFSKMPEDLYFDAGELKERQ